MDLSHVMIGAMPGDQLNISDIMQVHTQTVLNAVLPLINASTQDKIVIGVHGGSGAGKSVMSALLAHLLTEKGIKSYVLSGDNYPHRIPQYNDAERLQLFREGGIRALVKAGYQTPENLKIVQAQQEKYDDANPELVLQYPWYQHYLDGGREALSHYLGTAKEQDFDEVDNILRQFKEGATSIWLRRMGRTDHELWYETFDFTKARVLILEWTHSNSDALTQVDIPILLNSTPQETMAYRKARNRDGATDSPFTTMVLEIEQDKIHQQSHKARIIMTREGNIVDYATYLNLMTS